MNPFQFEIEREQLVWYTMWYHTESVSLGKELYGRKEKRQEWSST